MKMYEGCVLDGNQTVLAINSMDAEGSPDYILVSSSKIEYEILTDGVVRIYCGEELQKGLKQIPPGEQVCFRFGLGGYFTLKNAALTFNNCTDTVLEDITVYSSPGYMLAVFPRCENFTLKRYRVICPPHSKRLMASNVDAIHVMGLTGKLVVEDCLFEGLGDDAVNIHSTAGYITEIHPDRIKAVNRRFSIPLEHDWCQKGDIIAVYGRDFLQKGLIMVKDFKDDYIYTENMEGVIEEGDVIGNTAFCAETEVINCEIKNSRARALLLQTENIRVENCRFFGISLPAILLAPDMIKWHEVSPVKNALIKNCRFEKCAFTNLKESQMAAISVKVSHAEDKLYPAGVHKNIVICNNRFVNVPGADVYIGSSDGVKIFKNRTDSGTPLRTQLQNCKNCTIT